jgi:hypothetical protein
VTRRGTVSVPGRRSSSASVTVRSTVCPGKAAVAEAATSPSSPARITVPVVRAGVPALTTGASNSIPVEATWRMSAVAPSIQKSTPVPANVSAAVAAARRSVSRLGPLVRTVSSSQPSRAVPAKARESTRSTVGSKATVSSTATTPALTSAMRTGRRTSAS